MKTKKTPIKLEDVIPQPVQQPEAPVATPQDIEDEKNCANEVMAVLKKYNCTIVSNTAVAKIKNEGN